MREELRWRSEPLETLLHAVPIGLYLVDNDLRIQHLNRAAEQAFAGVEGGVVGRRMDETLKLSWPPEYVERAMQIFRHTLETGEPHRAPELVELRTERGKIEYYDWQVNRVDLRGGQYGVVCCFRDISDLLFTDISARRQAEERLRESEEHLRFTLHAAQFGTWDLDLRTPPPHRARRSLRHDQIFGYAELLPEWTDEMFFDHVVDEDRPAVKRSLRRAQLEGRDWQVECRIRRVDGAERWIWASGHAILDDTGRPQRLLGLVTDITERKRNEQALRAADQQKDEFLATLSHELRNPLAAIRAATSVLELVRETPPPVAEMTAIIARQSLQLIRLVDDLLDASRISRGKMTLQRTPVDIGRLVREMVADSHALCEKKGLRARAIVPEEPVVVEGDAVRIAQVVNNLMQNACQFTPPGGEIRARVERVEHEAVLCIADTGIGMSDDELERVFDMFVQVGQLPSHEGLGIGLSLSKSIVELHGGNIEACSAGPGKGSEFRVALPAIEPGGDD